MSFLGGLLREWGEGEGGGGRRRPEEREGRAVVVRAQEHLRP